MKISETFVPDEAYAEKGPSHDRGSKHEDEATGRQQSAAKIYNRDSQQHSSNTLPSDDEPRHRQQRDGSGVRKITPEQMLVIINFILQLLSAVIGLLNSNPRPLYSLILVSLSFASFVLWIIELVQRGKRERVTWKSRGKLIPLLYSSSTNKSFFQGADIVGLPSALFTFIITAVNFDLLIRHANTQIQITLWPIVASSFLLCSKFWADRTNKDALNLAQLHSISIDNPRSQYQKSSTILQVVNAYIRWGCDWCSQVCKNQWCSQINIERAFAIVNFILEIPSALLDQLSSEPKPQYALILMLLSLCSLILCIFELWYKGKTERVTWSWKWIRGKVLWLYANKSFFSFWDKVGLISAVVQLILTIVNYVLVVQHIGQVPICVFPIVFALVQSFSKIYDSPNKTREEGNVDEEDEVALIYQRQTVSEVMFLKTESEEEKSVLIRNQSHRVNQQEFPDAGGSVVQYDKIAHPNLRHRARKLSFPKEIEEPSWVNAAKRSLDELKEVKKSLNELNERACRLMNRNETVLVLKKYLASEIRQRIEHLKADCLVLGELFMQLQLANWVEKALDETQCRVNFEEKTLLELKRYSPTEIWKKIRGQVIRCWDFREMGKDLEQVNWVEKNLDETQNTIELEEKTFLKIKRDNENMLEVEFNKPQKFSTMEESDRSSLAEESLSELNKKTNWDALAKRSLDEIKKTERCLADVKTKVVAFNEKITSLKKAFDLPQICPDRHLSPTELQIIIEKLEAGFRRRLKRNGSKLSWVD